MLIKKFKTIPRRIWENWKKKQKKIWAENCGRMLKLEKNNKNHKFKKKSFQVSGKNGEK